jgi:Fe2+ or Zn2+ uptake regulation protein
VVQPRNPGFFVNPSTVYRILCFVDCAALYNLVNKLSGMPCMPDSHLYRVTNTRCRVGTVLSPDDGNIVAQNI